MIPSSTWRVSPWTVSHLMLCAMLLWILNTWRNFSVWSLIHRRYGFCVATCVCIISLSCASNIPRPPKESVGYSFLSLTLKWKVDQCTYFFRCCNHAVGVGISMSWRQLTPTLSNPFLCSVGDEIDIVPTVSCNWRLYFLYRECYRVCLMKVCIPLRGQMNVFVYGRLLNVSSDCSFLLSRKFADIFVHVICFHFHCWQKDWFRCLMLGRVTVTYICKVEQILNSILKALGVSESHVARLSPLIFACCPFS